MLTAVLWKQVFAHCVYACSFSQQCSLGKCLWSVEQEESGGSEGGTEEGRAWWEGGAPRQLSCEEANGLSSPSHVYRVFSDGHSSRETHIGLATGTELQPTSAHFYWDNLASVWTLVSLYVTLKLAENESVTRILWHEEVAADFPPRWHGGDERWKARVWLADWQWEW